LSAHGTQALGGFLLEPCLGAVLGDVSNHSSKSCHLSWLVLSALLPLLRPLSLPRYLSDRDFSSQSMPSETERLAGLPYETHDHTSPPLKDTRLPETCSSDRCHRTARDRCRRPRRSRRVGHPMKRGWAASSARSRRRRRGGFGLSSERVVRRAGIEKESGRVRGGWMARESREKCRS
jgi:hypothetical protein